MAQSTTVNYALSGIATEGSDYTLTGADHRVTIMTGRSSGSVKLKAKKDRRTEGTETATMTLQPGSGYQLGGTTQATVSILDGP